MKNNSPVLVQITASPSQLLLPNPVEGAVFIFGAKIDLKSTKNVLFCILFRPMGGLKPPDLATPLTKIQKEHTGVYVGHRHVVNIVKVQEEKRKSLRKNRSANAVNKHQNILT